jgi:hypothetical protein
MASGNAFEVSTNRANPKTPIPTTDAKYFSGYPPIKHNKSTIEKIIAVVEKFAGNINIKIAATGIHS